MNRRPELGSLRFADRGVFDWEQAWMLGIIGLVFALPCVVLLILGFDPVIWGVVATAIVLSFLIAAFASVAVSRTGIVIADQGLLIIPSNSWLTAIPGFRRAGGMRNIDTSTSTWVPSLSYPLIDSTTIRPLLGLRKLKKMVPRDILANPGSRYGNGIVFVGPLIQRIATYSVVISPEGPRKMWLVPTRHDPVLVASALTQAMKDSPGEAKTTQSSIPIPQIATDLSGRPEDAYMQLPQISF